jgi:hypothetical protein
MAGSRRPRNEDTPRTFKVNTLFFLQAVADFSIAYADQSERDHKVLRKAVKDGRLKVVIERE